MALLPSIPTSFVPHAPGAAPAPRSGGDAAGILAYFSYGVLIIAFTMAIGVFAYGQLLNSQRASKDAELAKAEASIDPSTVEGFVRLRNRLSYGAQELKSHVAFSNFFAALETLLPSTVRFASLHLAIDPSGAAVLDGAGAARSFNALAAFSNALAQDGRIKNAIFSKISVKNERNDSSVGFGLSATLDPKLIAFNPSSAVAAPAPMAPQSGTTTQVVGPQGQFSP